MRPYAKKTPLAAWSDRWLLRLCALMAGVAWFVFLWGASFPAVAAGLAYGGLLLLCVECFLQKTLHRREEQMRRQLGGERALDELLMQDARRASFRAAMWLTRQTPLTLERTTETGVLCTLAGKRALLLTIARHPSVPVDAQQLAEARREAARQKVEACVVCLTAPVGREAESYAENGEPPMRLVKREELLRLAGACSPATDEQLRAMGARKRRATPKRWLRHALSPRRAKRYLLYGLGLSAMYLATGLRYYPLPAALCLTMSLLCRLYRPREKEDFWAV